MRWLVLFGVWLAYMAFGVIVTSLAPLVALIVADLDLSHSAMGSVLGAWQVVYIFAAVPAGMLLDRLGGRWALTLGLLVIAVSAVGRAFADQYWTLLTAVMLFGIGGPVVSSGAPKVITDIFEGSQRGLAMGIYMTGPALGGILSMTLTHSVLLPWLDNDWRAVLLLAGGFAFVAAIVWLCIASLAHSRFTALQRSTRAAASAAPKGSKVLAELTRNPAVRLLLAMAVGAFLFNHGLNNWLPELLRSGGRSMVEAGYWAALPMVVGIIGSLTIPRLATPERRFKILLALSCAAAGASLALLLPGGDVVLAAGLILQGFVRASLMTVLILTLMELPTVAAKYAGTASGLFFSAAEIGGVLGPLGLGLMYDLSGGFAAGLYCLAAIGLALALGTRRLARLAKPPQAA